MPIVVSAILPLVIVPESGIAVLGLLAGSLASFFRLDNGKPSAGSPAAGEAEHAAVTSSDAALQALAAEVAALRHQLETLAARLTGALPGESSNGPAGDEDAPNNRCPCLTADLGDHTATVSWCTDTERRGRDVRPPG